MNRLLFALMLGIAVPNVAYASDDTAVEGVGNAFNAQAVVTVEASSVQTSGTATDIKYTYEVACQRGKGITEDGFFGCGDQLPCGQVGQVFNVWAHYPDGTSQLEGTYCYEEGEVAAQPQVMPGLVAEALRRVLLPESRILVQPPDGRTLVNLDTIFRTEAEPFTERVRLLGQRVDLRIEPTTYTWRHGDGTSSQSDWPGMAYEKGVPIERFLTHRYLDADVTVRPSVDTTWSATYRVNGGAWLEVPETVTMSGSSVALRVIEATPTLVG